MANIKVHLLNFHGPWSHIEIVLENLSVSPRTFYSINRWDDYPCRAFSKKIYKYETQITNLIKLASSRYSFEIQADPEEIVEKWRDYHEQTNESASCLGNNCAVAAQWFLNTFAKIPNPSIFSSKPISFNHLAFGICVPSFIPIGIELPGRIMDNAKYYIETRKSKPQPSSTGLFSNRNAVYLATLAAAMAVGYVSNLNKLN